MARKIRVEILGVTAGHGKPVRYLSYADADHTTIGTISKASGDNRLWCVDSFTHDVLISERDRCHGSYRAAMAFARRWFGGE